MEKIVASYERLRRVFDDLIEPQTGSHLTYRQVQADVRDGRLRAVRVRGQWRVDPADVPRYLATLIRPNTAPAA